MGSSGGARHRLRGGSYPQLSPSSIELLRNVYDCFLAKFPLFYGYWKKYADLEFAIGGTETAEMVSPATGIDYAR